MKAVVWQMIEFAERDHLRTRTTQPIQNTVDGLQLFDVIENNEVDAGSSNQSEELRVGEKSIAQ